MKTTTFSVCLIVIKLFLIVVLYEAFLSCKHDLYPLFTYSSRLKIPERSVFYRKVIPSAAESLYAMYGEGNFTDDDQHLLNYIRSMMSQQGPGGRHLSQPFRVDFSQVGGSQFVDKLLKKRRNGFFCRVRGIYWRESFRYALLWTRTQLDWNSDRGASRVSPRDSEEEQTCASVKSVSSPTSGFDEIQTKELGEWSVGTQQKCRNSRQYDGWDRRAVFLSELNHGSDWSTPHWFHGTGRRRIRASSSGVYWLDET